MEYTCQLTCALHSYGLDGRVVNMTLESSMKPYEGRSFYFHIQRVTNITLLMPDTQILKGILLHTKVKPFVIIYQNFNVDRVVLCVLLADQKRHLTITTCHCGISLNEPLEYGKLGGHY
ncbi:hypothetical protein Hanom_Chr09g00837811 [Helianthus anomalus]